MVLFSLPRFPLSLDFGGIVFKFLLGSAPIIHGLITLPITELVGRVKFWTSWEGTWYGRQPLRGSSVRVERDEQEPGVTQS